MENAELYANLVFPLPLEKPLSYSVPKSLRTRIVPGMRALAPLQSRTAVGVVVSLTETYDGDTVKPLIDLPDLEPLFDPDMLELCRWISAYYCCSWGEALFAALPAAVKGTLRRRYHLIYEQVASTRFSSRQKAVIVSLLKNSPQTEGQLAKSVGGQALSNTLASLVKRGILREEILFREESAMVLEETRVRLREEAIPNSETLLKMQKRAPRRAAVYLDLLYGDREQSATQLYQKHHADKTVLEALVNEGLVERFKAELYRRPAMHTDVRASTKHVLNTEQQQALDEILLAVKNREYRTILLHGITGSGKTEVYLQVIERVLTQGRSAIILVPEISLTPQTVGRFYARFNQDIAIFHSGLSDGERYDAWRSAKRGLVRIVVGARSAVFAPLANIGIIVVDEEHDNSYKQNETPRYHARDVAIVRARMHNAVCLLGSATPSIESFYNSECNKSTRLTLMHRATSGRLPSVKVIDMRQEHIETPGEIILSTPLEKAIQERLHLGEQVILLLNRRGFAPVVLCPSCGWVAQCEDCQVSLTYHSAGHILRCHYCGCTQPKPIACNQCGYNPLIFLGMGTQKAEDYLMRAFPGARVERMDADTTSGKGGHALILGRFAQHKIDILIGTQMLAKGHDYPGVTLVGVINADTGLTLPDFRAAEQVFQLITQVAGRAGRGDRPGEVYIQTYRPKHYAILAAANHDYHMFYEREIVYREEAGYPPFRRMVNFIIEGEDPLLTEKESIQLRRIACEQIERFGFRGIALLGPAPAAVRRVKKIYRWNFAMLSRSPSRVNQLARAAREAFETTATHKHIKIKIDLDPYGMF